MPARRVAPKRRAAKRRAPVAAVGRATRDLILDAAERRFAERGFAAVSVREIATDAGLKNQASLYTHFRNKRALYEATIARGLEPFTALLAVADGDTAAASVLPLQSDSVAAFLGRLLDHLAAHPHVPRLIQRAGLDDAPMLRRIVARLLQPVYTQGMRILSGLDGPWEPADLPQLAAGLYQLIFGYFANVPLMAAVTQKDPRSPAAMARQRRFLERAVTGLLGVAPRH
jgi:AcrR family transcriptional regulator